MGKRNEISPTRFPAKEQSDVRAFVRKLFEDNCPAEDAVAELRNKFDAEDFVRVRELWGKLNGSAAKEARGPRSKN